MNLREVALTLLLTALVFGAFIYGGETLSQEVSGDSSFNDSENAFSAEPNGTDEDDFILEEVPYGDREFFEKGKIFVKFAKVPDTFKNSEQVRSAETKTDALLLQFGVNRFERVFRDPKFPQPQGVNLEKIMVLGFPEDADIFKVAESFKKLSDVIYAEPAPMMYPLWTPNDPAFAGDVKMGSEPFIGQHYLHYPENDSFEKAWDITRGSPETVIAVLDTAFDIFHPDLRDKIWINPAEDINGNGKFDFYFDLNGDGVITISEDLNCNFTLDCASASWGEDINGNRMLDIFHEDFSFLGLTDGADINDIDDDGNGYVDDVAGWDFWNNSPMVSRLPSGWQQFKANKVNCDVGGTVSGGCTTTPDGIIDGCDFTRIPIGSPHGTIVAGIAGATTNNGVGIAGACPECKILPLRIANDTGGIPTETAVKAIHYAADLTANGERVVDVVNMSFGGGSMGSSVMEEAIAYARARDILFVGAAGNDNDPLSLFPTAFDGVLSVGAVSSTAAFNSVIGNRHDVHERGYFSNYGLSISLSAPGWMNTSIAGPSGATADCPDSVRYYGHTLAGTSFSAPIVSGVAGLVRSLHPDWTEAQVREHLEGTSLSINRYQPIDRDGALNRGAHMGFMGFGAIDPSRACLYGWREVPKLIFGKYRIDDSALGNGNGIADAGETLYLYITLQNIYGKGTDIKGALTAINIPNISENRIEVLQGSASFPDAEQHDGSAVEITNAVPFVVRVASDAPANKIAYLDLTIEARGETGALWTDTERFMFHIRRAKQKDGFPFWIEKDLAETKKRGYIASQPKVLDITGDGRNEIIFLVSSLNNLTMYAIDSNGTELARSPAFAKDYYVTVPVSELAAHSDASYAYVFFAYRNNVYGLKFSQNDGWEEIVDGDGNPSTFGVFAAGNHSLITLGDLTGDGTPEIIASPNINAWRLDGTRIDGFPVLNTDYFASVAVADVNNDGREEIIFGNRIYGSDGKELAQSPLFSQTPSNSIIGCTAVADLDTDGFYEIIWVTIEGAPGSEKNTLEAVDINGKRLPGFPLSLNTAWMETNVSISDITGSGAPEIILSGRTRSARISQVVLAGKDASGTYKILPGWPKTVQDRNTDNFAPTKVTCPIPVRLDSDDKAEILVLAGFKFRGGGGFLPGNILFAYNFDGTHASYPQFESGFFVGEDRNSLQVSLFTAEPLVCDLDGDGELEILLSAGSPYLGVYEAGPNSTGGRSDWPMARHDDWNTSRYGAKSAPSPIIRSVTPASGDSAVAVNVRILGENFAQNVIATLGEYSFLNLKVVSESEIRATVPAGIPLGAYDLTVTNINDAFKRTALLKNAYEVTGANPQPAETYAYVTLDQNSAIGCFALRGSSEIVYNKEISVPGCSPWFIAKSPGEEWLVATLRGCKKLALIDTLTQTAISAVDVSYFGDPMGAAFAGDELLVTFTDTGIVARFLFEGLFDGVADEADIVDVYQLADYAPGAVAVTPDNARALVTSCSRLGSAASACPKNEVAIIRLNDGTIETISSEYFYRPNYISVSKDGSCAAITNRAVLSDSATKGYVATLDLSADPTSIKSASLIIRPDGKYAGQMESAFDGRGKVFVVSGTQGPNNEYVYSYESCELGTPFTGGCYTSGVIPRGIRISAPFDDAAGAKFGFTADRGRLGIIKNLDTLCDIGFASSPYGLTSSQDLEVLGPAKPAVWEVFPSEVCSFEPMDVNIYGRNFFPDSAVVFVGADGAIYLPTRTVYVSSVSLVVTFDALPADDFTVEVRNPSGNKATAEKGFRILRAPTVSDISPKTVSAAGGEVVRITGENFYGDLTRVFADGSEVSAAILDSATIEFTAPSHAEGFAEIAVQNGDCSSDAAKAQLIYIDGDMFLSWRKGTTSGHTRLEIYALEGKLSANPKVWAQGPYGNRFEWDVLSAGAYKITVQTTPFPASSCSVSVDNDRSGTLTAGDLKKDDAFTYANFAYASNMVDGTVSVIDTEALVAFDIAPETSAFDAISVGELPIGIAVSKGLYSGRYLYVLSDDASAPTSLLDIFETGNFTRAARLNFLTDTEMGAIRALNLVADPLDPLLYIVSPTERPIYQFPGAEPIPCFVSVIDVSNPYQPTPIPFDADHPTYSRIDLHNGIDADGDGYIDGTNIARVKTYPIDMAVALVPKSDALSAGDPIASPNLEEPTRRYGYVSTAGEISVHEEEICLPIIVDPSLGAMGAGREGEKCHTVYIKTRAPNRVSVVDLNPWLYDGNGGFLPNANFGREISVLGDPALSPLSNGDIPQDLGLDVAVPDGAFVCVLNRTGNFMLKLNANTQTLETRSGDPAGRTPVASLTAPWSIAKYPPNDSYIVGEPNTGYLLEVSGDFSSVRPIRDDLDGIGGVAIAGSDIIVSENSKNLVHRISIDGEILWSVAVNNPVGAAVEANGNILVAESGASTGAIHRFNANGAYLNALAQGALNGPRLAGVMPDGAIAVAEREGGRLLKLNPETGEIVQTLYSDLREPTGMLIEPDGAILVSDYVESLIFRFDPRHEPGVMAADRGAPVAGIASDGRGNIIACDYGEGALVKIAELLRIPLRAEPTDVAFARKDSIGLMNLYIAQAESDSVREVDFGASAVAGDISLTDDSRRAYPTSLDARTSGDRVLVANFLGDSVSVIDAATSSVVAQIATDAGPRRIDIQQVFDFIKWFDRAHIIVMQTPKSSFKPAGMKDKMLAQFEAVKDLYAHGVPTPQPYLAVIDSLIHSANLSLKASPARKPIVDNLTASKGAILEEKSHPSNPNNK